MESSRPSVPLDAPDGPATDRRTEDDSARRGAAWARSEYEQLIEEIGTAAHLGHLLHGQTQRAVIPGVNIRRVSPITEVRNNGLHDHNRRTLRVIHTTPENLVGNVG